MRKRQYGCKCIKLEFHRTYLVMALGFVLTGYYLNLLVFTSLILVHELGHYLMAMINQIKVTKIVIYPYGGMTKIDDKIDLDISRELLVATAGVIMQYLFYLLMGYCYQKGIIRGYTYQLYTLYNNQMIFFNLLPIYPLDGSKILNLLLDKYFPYYRSNILTMLISIIGIVIIMGLSIYSCNYSNLMVMGLLFTYLYQFFKKRKFLYQRFLLERYLYGIDYTKIKVIKDIRKMYRNRSHLFYYNHKYLSEKDMLRSFFGK